MPDKCSKVVLRLPLPSLKASASPAPLTRLPWTMWERVTRLNP
jgi:hypothetical protein